MKGKSIRNWVFVVLLGLAAQGAALIHTAPTMGAVSAAAAAEVPSSVQHPVDSYAPALKQALPAVVSISSSRVVRTSDRGSRSPFEDFFGFGGPQAPRMPESPRREGGQGSGVIVSPDGYILTNHHVVDGATEVSVTLADRREMKAKVVGSDSKADLALLKVEANDLPVLPLGDSSRTTVGDVVLAVGNPFGIGKTVTMGIVSATGRGNLGIEDYEDFIQTDAAINPGNSGGALVNTRGELIGINTAILSGSGGNQGIGFAIPSNMARDFMGQIKKDGRVTRSWLGASIQEVTPQIAKAFGLAGPEGALVASVVPDSPAEKAGLQQGDVILELNGSKIEDARMLRLAVSRSVPGTSVNLKIKRNGALKDVAVKLDAMPSETPKRADSANPDRGKALEGVAVENITPDIRRELDLPARTKGVVISEVEPGSAAANSGLRRGDVIESLDHKPVTSAAEFERLASSAKSDSVLVLVNRGGSDLFLVLDAQA